MALQLKQQVQDLQAAASDSATEIDILQVNDTRFHDAAARL